jgi:hypothetical protein
MLPSRAATVAPLPSALFYERCFARCKLGVLVSAGVGTCLSTSSPIQPFAFNPLTIPYASEVSYLSCSRHHDGYRIQVAFSASI